MSYLERYLNGERVEVWKELVALGAAVRNAPVYSDAKAVATETMRRARHNIDLLVKRLHEINYLFTDPDDVFTPSNAALINQVDEFERQIGPVPLSIRAWVEIVGTVNFEGTYPYLCCYVGLEYDPANPAGSYDDSMIASDPLVFFFERIAVKWYQDWRDDKAAYPHHYEGYPNFLALIAPDSDHKSNYSGGANYAIELPDASADARLWSLEPEDTFVEYLRLSFAWGGFPDLRYRERDGKLYDRAVLAKLKEGLLPL